MWVKLDDKLHAHPKVQRAWHSCTASLGLHMLALSHAGSYFPAGHPRVGHVPEEFVRLQLRNRQARTKAVKALVDAGLWEPVEGGWQIHDFLDANPLRARKDRNGSSEAPPLFDVISPSRARPHARTPAGAPAHAAVPSRPVPSRPVS